MSLVDKLTAIGNAIREKTGKTDLIPLADMPDEILSISSGETEINPVYYAKSLSFQSAVFPENYNFVLKVQKFSELTNMFMRANVKTVKLISDVKDNILDYHQTFRDTTELETVDVTECSRNVRSVAYMFLGASSIKSVYGALDFTNCTNTTIWLNGASKLEDIEFVPNTIKISIPFQWCTILSKASITSAINGLDNTVTGQTITFSKTAVNNAFTEEEWNTLIATKTNWTITLG